MQAMLDGRGSAASRPPGPGGSLRIRLASTLLLALLLAPAAADAGTPAPPAATATSYGRLWQAPPAGADAEGRRMQLRRNQVNVVKLALAAAGGGLLLWGAALGRAGRPDAWRRERRAALAVLGLASLFAGWNFFYFHYPAWIHAHDTFNYYIGAKYFPELGYTRQYECTAVADLQAGLRRRVAGRLITNLETYELESTAAILADPERCTRHFSPARWALFRHDVGWFRSRLPIETWEALQRDHGYNPTPVWGILGTWLSSSASASAGQIFALTLLDPLLLLAMWACVVWAFGWPACCVALLYWGTNYPAEFGWTGGSFLREDWLAATGIGLCLLKRDKPLAAGFLLTHAALLRLFPALALLGIAAAAAWQLWERRSLRLERSQRRLVLGALAALVLLLPLSSWTAGSPRAWSDFAANMSLHVGTSGNNSMGWKTALSWSEAGRLVRLAPRAADPSAAWKAARHARFGERRAVYWLGVAAGLALLLWALRRQEPWVAGVLGLGTLPLVLEPACYYTSALLLFGLLWTRRPAVGVALCGLSVAGWVFAACWSEWDDIFAATSIAMLLFVGFATAWMGLQRAEPA